MAAPGQHLTQGSRMEQRLAARMLPALTILELPAVELGAYLREAYETNEALTLEEPSALAEAPPAPETPDQAARAGDEAAGEVERDDFQPARRAGGAEASDRHAEWLAAQPAPDPGLVQAVEEQLAFVDFPDARTEAWVRVLVGELDERGMLPQDDDALLLAVRAAGLLERFPLGDGPEAIEVALEEALAVLRRLEPTGLGARTAVEALLLQLDPEDPDAALLRALLVDFLEELSANKLPVVASALGLGLDELGRLLGRLGELTPPAPSAAPAAPTIHPEVVVEEDEDGFRVAVDGAAWPAVGIDEDLRAMAGAADPGLRRYLRGKLDQARWIVDAVEQRRTTLLRVARATFAMQRAFLEHGPGHLAPLRMRDVAELCGVHRSTVSRAVAGKHAWTPWGVYPLKHFFQGAVGDADAPGSAARDDVRDLVRAVVDAEDKRAPLSDEAIVEALAARGQAVARRTVAKYRRELGIASSYRRRDHLAG